jgi:hypothetical protein
MHTQHCLESHASTRLTDGCVAVVKSHSNEERPRTRGQRRDPHIKEAAISSMPLPKISGFGVHAMQKLLERLFDNDKFGRFQTKTGPIELRVSDDREGGTIEAKCFN